MSTEKAESDVEIQLPPDKSLFHRLLFLAALCEGQVDIPLDSEIADDIQTTIDALRTLGVTITQTSEVLLVNGVGRRGFIKPTGPIDCRNSGTTARFLMGILVAQDFDSELIGDPSLSKRPMKRLAELLNDSLQADITCSNNGTLPVSIHGKKLQSGSVALPVASAQMKSAVLLAAYCSDIEVTITEPHQSRDHTERMMQAFGVDVQFTGNELYLGADRRLQPKLTYAIGKDPSAAAFFVVAAAIMKQDIAIKGVILNPTRALYLDVLLDSGLPIIYENIRQIHSEPVADIYIFGSQAKLLKPFLIDGVMVPNLQDELPALCIAALFATGKTVILEANELRLKESDRLKALSVNLKKVGAIVSELPDGLIIEGSSGFIPNRCVVEHFGDHRIAMAMAVLGLKIHGDVTIPDSSVVSISFPLFFSQLAKFSTVGNIRPQ